MTGYEHTIFATRSGSILGTGFGCPRCFRVLDSSGSDMAPGPRVDLRTAFALLAQSARANSSQADRRSSRAQLPFR